MPLTPKQQKKIEKLQELENDNLLTIANDIVELEDKIESEVNSLKEIVLKVEAQKGDIGDKGEKGDKGDKGDKGERGEKGEKGEKGDRGEKGKDGIDGKDGRDGLDGKDGKDGRDGKDAKQDKETKKVVSSLKKDVSVIKEYDIPTLQNRTQILNQQVTGLSREIDEIKNDDSFNPVDTIEFNTSYTPTGTETTGTTYWDDANHTISTVLENGAILQHGFELYTYGTDEGNDFPEGSPVSVKGSTGNKVAFELTDITDNTSADNYIGLLTTAPDSGNRIATREGAVRGINTTGSNWGETWAEGDFIYVGATAGSLTNVEPTTNRVIRVGTVTNRHATEGVIELDRLVIPTLQDVTDAGATTTKSISVGGLTDTSKTAGSVLFAGTGGLISQDNANFYFDDTNNYLRLLSKNNLGTFNALVFGRIDGNARGDRAIDIQVDRSDNTRVASGAKSICFGTDNVASGSTGFAIGYDNQNSGNNSTALGQGNTISSYGSVAVGYSNTAGAYANSSTVVGSASTVSGFESTVVGYGNSDTGYGYNSSFGSQNTIGDSATSITAVGGYNNAASYADTCTMLGYANTAGAYANFSAIVGSYNTTVGFQSTVVGYGNYDAGYGYNSSFGSQNAVGDGAASITAVGYGNNVADNTDSSTVIGSWNSATGGFTGMTGIGYGNIVSNTGANAFGIFCTSSSNFGTMIGAYTQLTERFTVALGIRPDTGVTTPDTILMQANDSTAQLRRDTYVLDARDLGSEILPGSPSIGTFTSDTGWTKGTNWTISGGKATHNGVASNLSPSTPLTITVGKMYRLSYTVSSWVAGTITPSCGGWTGDAVDFNAQIVRVFRATATTNLSFAASASSNFSIDDVSLKEITGGDLFVNAGGYFNGGAFPAISDGSALGSTSYMWSDLFLASGGVINFNNGNMTITHSSGVLDYKGGSHRFGDGTNYLQIDSDGDLSLVGTAKYERHIQIPAFTAGNPSTQPTQDAIGSAGGLVFSSSTNQSAYIQWEIPDDWDGGNVYIEVDWAPYSAGMTGTDTIKWDLDYRSIAEGETLTNGTLKSLTTSDSNDYTQYQTKHTRFTLTFNDASQPLTVQDHVYFKFTRDTGVANDFAGTVIVTAFEVIYTSTGFPSSN